MKIKPWWTLLIPILLATSAAYGQLTQVRATVKDSNGQLYVNCQWSVVFVNQNTTPGAGPSQPAALLVGQQGHCDSSGNLTVSLADNVITITPRPSQWNFSICSAPGYIPGGTYCRSNMLVTVTGQAQDLTSYFTPLMPILPTGGGGTGTISGSGTANILTQFTGPTTIGNSPLDNEVTFAAVVHSSLPFDSPLFTAGPVSEPNSYSELGVNYFDVLNSVDPLPSEPGGDGGFGIAPGGIPMISTNGGPWLQVYPGQPGTTVTVNGTAPVPNSLNFNSAAPLPPAGNTNVIFQLNGTNVSGYVPSGGTGGVGGSGTAAFMAQWTAPSTLGNGFITSSLTQVNLGTSSAQPFLTPTTGAAGVVSVVHDQTPNCTGADGAPPTFGCKGWQITFVEQSPSTPASSNVNAALEVLADGNNTSVRNLTGIGIFAQEKSSSSINSQAAGDFLSIAGTFAAQVTSFNRGLIAEAYNAGQAPTQPQNEALVAQSGFNGASGSTTTTDYTIHCMAPNGVGLGTMTAHVCVRVDAQATGVELQLGPHTFAGLPACNSTYEGSLAAITDSTVTTGAIAGGGTNHVLAYCNGTSWLAK